MPTGNFLFLDTRYGRVVMEMRPDLAPQHVARITDLTNQHFYDALLFHRVINNFVAQGGDPLGNGTGGTGVKLPLEFNGLPYLRGTVGMARASDPNSADSQFFICFTQVSLSGDFTVWAFVQSGMEFVDQLTRVQPSGQTPPPNADRIELMTVQEVNLINGTAAAESLIGGDGQDLLNGGEGNDSLAGLVANDTLDGGNGADTLVGGDGADYLVGGNGDDLILPGLGGDRIDAGAGNDTLSLPGNLADYRVAFSSGLVYTLRPGNLQEGIDLILGVENVAFADQTVPTGNLAGTLSVNGLSPTFDAGNNLGFGGSFNDSLDGANGNDTLFGFVGSDGLLGGNGNDLLFGDFPGAGADFIFAGAGNDTAFGGDGQDSITGASGDDVLNGDAGNDTISGSTDDDVLNGGAGNDWLLGEQDNDTLIGGPGADTLFGGLGNDRIVVDGADAFASGGDGNFDVVVITDNVAGLTSLNLGNAANQNASVLGPVLQGFNAVDAGPASVAVSVVGAVINNRGNAIIGSAFNDTITGSSDGDKLVGGGGNDSIVGGEGNDSIAMDAGNDTVSGGAGADSFFYPGGAAAGAVRIADFVPADDTTVLPAALGFATGALALAAVQQVGADAVLSFGAGQSITFVGVQVAALTAADFQIV